MAEKKHKVIIHTSEKAQHHLLHIKNHHAEIIDAIQKQKERIANNNAIKEQHKKEDMIARQAQHEKMEEQRMKAEESKRKIDSENTKSEREHALKLKEFALKEKALSSND